jgi:hypothetical protein
MMADKASDMILGRLPLAPAVDVSSPLEHA